MSFDLGYGSGSPPGPGPRRLGDILGEMFRLFGRNLALMLLLVAIIVVPLIVAGVAAFGPEYVDALMGDGVEGMPDSPPQAVVLALIVYFALYALGMVAVTGAVSEAAARSMAGLERSVGHAYGAAFRRLPHMLGAGLVAAVVVALPVGLAAMLMLPVPVTGSVRLAVFLVLLLASVYLGVRLMFAPLVALFQQTGPLSAVARSWDLVSGAWWRTFGLLLLIGLILGVLQSAIGFLLSALPAVEALVTSLIVLPLSLIGNLLIYMDLRARKQTYRTEDLAGELESLAS